MLVLFNMQTTSCIVSVAYLRPPPLTSLFTMSTFWPLAILFELSGGSWVVLRVAFCVGLVVSSVPASAKVHVDIVCLTGSHPV